MHKIIIVLSLVLSFTASSRADEVMNIPQNLNDNLTTGSGYSAPTENLAQPATFKYSQGAAQCHNNESQARSGGSTEADAATAYYDCLKQMISE